MLHRLLRENREKAEIARLMNRDRSTIYRELTRNSGQRGYRPTQAQRLTDQLGMDVYFAKAVLFPATRNE